MNGLLQEAVNALLTVGLSCSNPSLMVVPTLATDAAYVWDGTNNVVLVKNEDVPMRKILHELGHCLYREAGLNPLDEEMRVKSIEEQALRASRVYSDHRGCYGKCSKTTDERGVSN